MRKSGKIMIAVAIFLLIFIVAFVLYMEFMFLYHFESPRKTVLRKHGRCVTLFTHGALMAHRISFLVKDANTYVWIGTVDADDSLNFSSVYWSKDGSVIASKSNNIYTKLLTFTHAYDFSNHKVYTSKQYSFDKESDWLKLSKEIEGLLESRGGIGEEFSRDSLYSTNVEVPYFEWRDFNKLEKCH